jgi:hypothetical protein
MKKLTIFILPILFILLLPSCKKKQPTETKINVVIGQEFQGGIVAYLLKEDDIGYDSNIQHGIIVSTSDQSSMPWGCEGTLISNTQSIIGSGMQNTNQIASSCFPTGIASKVCKDLVLNGYSDWYLPSKNELETVRTNLYFNNLGNLTGVYWSSTEKDAINAYPVQFTNGTVNMNKNLIFKVRAVRSF